MKEMKTKHKHEMNITYQKAKLVAKKFVQNCYKKISKAAEIEIKSVLSQFIDFRNLTWEVLENFSEMKQKVMVADKMVCQVYPIRDFWYRSPINSPFQLYDCLKPALVNFETT